MSRDSYSSPDQHCDLEDLSLLALGEDIELDADHLQSCEQCRSQAAELRRVVRTARTITLADAPTAPPASVWDAIERQMRTNPSDHEAAPMATVIPLRARKAPWIALAAVVGLFFGGIFGVVAMNSNTPPAPIVAQTELAPLPGFNATGVAKLEATETGDMLAVNLTDLPASDGGYFEVWLITEDASSMISLGAVGAGNSTRLPIPPGLSLERYRMVDISSEQFDGDATHSTISVVRGTLLI